MLRSRVCRKVLLVLGLIGYGVLAWYLYTRPEAQFGLANLPASVYAPDTGGCGGGSVAVDEASVKAQLERNQQLLEQAGRP